MPLDELPGYTFAIQRHYTLYAFAGDHHQAHYQKDAIQLEVKIDGDKLLARMYTYINLVKCEIDWFSLPNKNFGVFEMQIRNILNGMGDFT